MEFKPLKGSDISLVLDVLNNTYTSNTKWKRMVRAKTIIFNMETLWILKKQRLDFFITFRLKNNMLLFQPIINNVWKSIKNCKTKMMSEHSYAFFLSSSYMQNINFCTLLHFPYHVVRTLPTSVNILWIYQFRGYRRTPRLFWIFHRSENAVTSILHEFLFLWHYLYLSIKVTNVFTVTSDIRRCTDMHSHKQCGSTSLRSSLHWGLPSLKIFTILKKGQWGAASQQMGKCTVEPSVGVARQGRGYRWKHDFWVVYFYTVLHRIQKIITEKHN